MFDVNFYPEIGSIDHNLVEKRYCLVNLLIFFVIVQSKMFQLWQSLAMLVMLTTQN